MELVVFSISIKIKNHCSKSSKIDFLLFLSMKTNNETTALYLQKGVLRRFEGCCLKRISAGKPPEPHI